MRGEVLHRVHTIWEQSKPYTEYTPYGSRPTTTWTPTDSKGAQWPLRIRARGGGGGVGGGCVGGGRGRMCRGGEGEDV